eukprot:COSAG04_NODE_4240_length_2212_cov_12.780880_5_plen_133_part_00
MDVLTQLPAKHRRTVVVGIPPADATKLRELRAALEAADRANGGEQVGGNGAFCIASQPCHLTFSSKLLDCSCSSSLAVFCPRSRGCLLHDVMCRLVASSLSLTNVVVARRTGRACRCSARCGGRRGWRSSQR